MLLLRRFTRDRGACGHDAFTMGEKEGPAAIVANSIWLTHFCYSNDRVFSDWLHGHWRACFGACPRTAAPWRSTAPQLRVKGALPGASLLTLLC